MKRRTLLLMSGSASLGLVLPSLAQMQSVKRVGWLGTVPAGHPIMVENFREFGQEMQGLGWQVGRNLILDYRHGLADPELHRANAKALVESRVDLILAVTEQPTEAAFQATRSIPIVAIANAAIEMGYAKSLSRTGGNLTGVVLQSRESLVKPMQILLAVRPGLRKLGWTQDFSSRTVQLNWAHMSGAAQTLGIATVKLPDVRDVAGIEPMVTAAKREGVQALVLPTRPFLKGDGARRIQRWAMENGVLTWAGNWQRGEFLLTFGPDLPSLGATVRRQVDQILRGANPAEIPIEEPSVFDVILNHRIAKAMGLTIAQSVLLQATEVIE